MAEKLRAGVILSSFIAFTAWADIPSSSAIVTPPQPQWSELTIEQKIILAPLSDDWDAMENYRQKKWLGITRRFCSMTPEEQRRIQVQMQDWGKLTPEQRRLARENFKTAKQLPAEKKEELKQKWEEYSSLPEEEKARLKQQAESKPAANAGRVTTSVPPSTATNPPASSVAPVVSRPPTPETAGASVASSTGTPLPGEAETKR